MNILSWLSLFIIGMDCVANTTSNYTSNAACISIAKEMCSFGTVTAVSSVSTVHVIQLSCHSIYTHACLFLCMSMFMCIWVCLCLSVFVCMCIQKYL
jgi:hypothetical protein